MLLNHDHCEKSVIYYVIGNLYTYVMGAGRTPFTITTEIPMRVSPGISPPKMCKTFMAKIPKGKKERKEKKIVIKST